ncbi:sensor histidine kinase [Pedobacter sp. GSP4]|uniref:sensor histidine kinase n=1 Tax=Pedobacter sp. GSP4 TaxID=3453716 RepID=UPI003EEAE67B
MAAAISSLQPDGNNLNKNNGTKNNGLKISIDSIPQQAWVADNSGNIIAVNRMICHDFGLDSEDIIRSRWTAFVHPDDLGASIASWQRALETGSDYSTEFRLLFSDGSYHWHLAKAIRIRNEGRDDFWMGINTNIDLQKKNESIKDEFISVASHELKTPMTTIKGYNQLLMRMTGDPLPLSLLERSASQLIRLEKLIADLMDVSKINAGKMELNRENFDFAAMARETVAGMQQISPSHCIELRGELKTLYHGDQFRIEQVLQNFISNAIKYSPGAELIIVSMETQQENIIVSVRDFGIGIAREHLHRLFDRYYRADNAATRFDGLGMGLFISADIIKRHGGSFWIESEPRQGSTFFFKLPLKPYRPAVPLQRSSNYYRDAFIEISCPEGSDIMSVDWVGHQDMHSVKHGGKLMIEYLGSNHCSKVFNDNRKVLGTWSEASDWAAETWLPQMELAGLRQFAWVFSPSAFSQLSAVKSTDNNSKKARIAFFSDADEARGWLSSDQ